MLEKLDKKYGTSFHEITIPRIEAEARQRRLFA